MIPARSGSKGLPNKNIMNLCGRPLMGYSIEAALGCEKIKEVFVNSESKEYLDLGRDLGAQPFLRPIDIANDDTSMHSVVSNFVEGLESKGNIIDAVIVLYPVYPLRNSDDLTRILTEFEEIGVDRSLIGMKAPDTHPYLCYKLDEYNSLKPVMNPDPNIHYRRQTYPKQYELTHWACVLPVNILPTLNAQLMNEYTYGYIIPNLTHIVDIDTILDFQYAEFLIQSGIYKP